MAYQNKGSLAGSAAGTSGADAYANFDDASLKAQSDHYDDGGGSAAVQVFPTNSYGYTQGAYDAGDINQLQQFGSKFAQAAPGDYSKFNGSLASAAMSQMQGDQSAAFQRAAMNNDASIAMGRTMSPAYQTAAMAGQQGMAYQQAAAGSALGGSLGQAAALRQNAQASAGLQATNQSQLGALAASEQAAAAQRYAQSSNALRQGNLAGVNASAQQGQAYANNAMDQGNFYNQQRSLADQANLFGQNAAMQANVSNYNQQQSEANLNEANLEAERKARQESHGVLAGFIGSTVKGAASAVAMSDARAKEPVSLGYAAHRSMMR